MLASLAEPAARAQANVLSPFTPQERTVFLRLLEKFVGEFNGSTRVPLGVHRANGKRDIRGGKAKESAPARVT
jgi:hypothetical protein